MALTNETVLIGDLLTEISMIGPFGKCPAIGRGLFGSMLKKIIFNHKIL